MERETKTYDMRVPSEAFQFAVVYIRIMHHLRALYNTLGSQAS